MRRASCSDRIEGGGSGPVIACEPEPGNLNRRHMDVSRNGLRNADVRPIAVGSHDGKTNLRLGDDSAYHTTASTSELLTITAAHETREQMRVPLIGLDTLWADLGTPSIDLTKSPSKGPFLKGACVSSAGNDRGSCSRRSTSSVSRHISVRWTTVQPGGFFKANFVFAPR